MGWERLRTPGGGKEALTDPAEGVRMTSPAPGHGPQAGPCVGWEQRAGVAGMGHGEEEGHYAARRDEGSQPPPT